MACVERLDEQRLYKTWYYIYYRMVSRIESTTFYLSFFGIHEDVHGQWGYGE